MTFDPTKPVQTRDGREARVLCTDLNCSKPIVAAYQTHEGSQELVRSFNKDGSTNLRFKDTDLINKPETRYINIWITSDGDIRCSADSYLIKQDAEDAAYNGNYLHIGLEIKI